MTEMIERVARASFKAYCDRNNLQFKFEDMHSDELEFAMLHARAMIEAMRELPEEPGPRYTSGEYSRRTQESMVDDALGVPRSP